MSIDPSQPVGDRREPPFWGPDGRYHPPSDIGEIPFDELPGHLELPRVGRGFFLDGTAPCPCRYELHETQEQSHLTEEQARFVEEHAQAAAQIAAELRENAHYPDRPVA